VLSRSSEYAIRALSLLSEQKDNGALHSREIAAELDLPPDFLTKILRRLTGTDLVTSQRGRTGGFRLNRPAAEISLLAVVAPFEPQWSGVECLLGQVSCTDRKACPIHDPWVEIRRNLYDLLENTTLADVADRATRGARSAGDNISGEHST
jgi:Rrf2 family protein